MARSWNLGESLQYSAMRAELKYSTSLFMKSSTLTSLTKNSSMNPADIGNTLPFVLSFCFRCFRISSWFSSSKNSLRSPLSGAIYSDRSKSDAPPSNNPLLLEPYASKCAYTYTFLS